MNRFGFIGAKIKNKTFDQLIIWVKNNESKVVTNLSLRFAMQNTNIQDIV